jgi:hypothetical protein
LEKEQHHRVDWTGRMFWDVGARHDVLVSMVLTSLFSLLIDILPTALARLCTARYLRLDIDATFPYWHEYHLLFLSRSLRCCGM